MKTFNLRPLFAALSALFLLGGAQESSANDVRLHGSRRIDANEQFFGHNMVISRNPFYLGLECRNEAHRVWITVYEVKPSGGVNRSQSWRVTVPRSAAYKDRQWFRIRGMTPGMAYAFSLRHDNPSRMFPTSWWMCAGRWSPAAPTGAARAIYVGNRTFNAYTPGAIGQQPAGGLRLEVLPPSVR